MKPHESHESHAPHAHRHTASGPRVPGNPDWTFDLCGSHLAFDFANTVSSRSQPRPIERLFDFEQLVRFCEQTGIADGRAAARARAFAAREPKRALALTRSAVELRDAMYGVFAALAEERKPAAADLDELSRWHARLRLGTDLAWHHQDGDDAPEALLVPVVRAAIDVLTQATRERTKMCALDTCRWVFLDTSKNGSRVWCDMKQCGNREKARRFAARARKRA